MISDDELCENVERQEAEFEFIAAAYSPDEAWVTNSVHAVGGYKLNQIHRHLDMPLDYDLSPSSSSSCVSVELILSLPKTYPTDENAILEIDASISTTSSSLDVPNSMSSTDLASFRKMAMGALPDLLRACRSTATEYAGCEAVFVVLSRADEWIDNEWAKILQSTKSDANISLNDSSPKLSAQIRKLLARKLIYSHHIIAKTKRKAIGDLAREYNLGGYAKIGWPGIIIIEGEEGDCNSFIDEIRSMRWQHLVVRGEESEEIGASNSVDGNLDSLDDFRKFPNKMTELAEDQMSYLSEICRDVGLEDLFMTSMKIYKQADDGNDENVGGANSGTPQEVDNEALFGTLVLVDHMNDKKGYTKWIHKACKSSGCSCMVKRCFQNDDCSLRPIIFVGIVGDETSVRKVLKRWRTSRVDVDSKGNPCLERMKKVMAEGQAFADFSEEDSTPSLPRDGSSSDIIYLKDLESVLASVGGLSWVDVLKDTIRSKTSN